MSEKMERNIKIGVAIFCIIIALFTVVRLVQYSNYDDAAHQIEQGQLPVYVEPPADTDGTGAETNSSIPVKPKINKSDYIQMTYKELIDHAKRSDKSKVFISGTIYSSMNTKGGNIYSIADSDGNYYSVIDKTNCFEKFNTAEVVLCWGRATNMAKLNSQDIPQITVDALEKN